MMADDIGEVAGREYKSREFCKDVQCPMQGELEKCAGDAPRVEVVKNKCRTECGYFSDELLHWLGQHGYVTSQEVKLDYSGETAWQLHDRVKKSGIKIFKKE